MIKRTSGYRIVALSSLFLISVFSLVIVYGFNSAVSAARDVYPRGGSDYPIFSGGSDSNNGYLEVATEWPDSSLRAHNSAADVYFDTTGLKLITIEGGKSCGAVDVQQSLPDGSFTTTFSVGGPLNMVIGNSSKSNAGDCSVDHDVKFNFNIPPDAAPNEIVGSTKLYRVRVSAVARTTVGGFVNAFKVSADGDGRVYVTLPESAGGTDDNSYFAIQRRPGQGSDPQNFAIYFAPNCNLNEDNTPTRFYWYDDDWNAGPQNPPGGANFGLHLSKRSMRSAANWTPVNINDSGSRANSPLPATINSQKSLANASLGPMNLNYWRKIKTSDDGSKDSAVAEFSVDKGQEYRLIFTQVAGTNGIRFKMPYNEIYRLVGCGRTETRPLCYIGTTAYYELSKIPSNYRYIANSPPGTLGSDGARGRCEPGPDHADCAVIGPSDTYLYGTVGDLQVYTRNKTDKAWNTGYFFYYEVTDANSGSSFEKHFSGPNAGGVPPVLATLPAGAERQDSINGINQDIGAHTYNVRIMQFLAPNTRLEKANCGSITYIVYDKPVMDPVSVDCKIIGYNIYWAGRGYGAGATITVDQTGSTKAVTGSNTTETYANWTNGPLSGSKLLPYEAYTLSFSATDDWGGARPNNTIYLGTTDTPIAGSCFEVSCTLNLPGNPDTGHRVGRTLTYGVNNKTLAGYTLSGNIISTGSISIADNDTAPLGRGPLSYGSTNNVGVSGSHDPNIGQSSQIVRVFSMVVDRGSGLLQSSRLLDGVDVTAGMTVGGGCGSSAVPFTGIDHPYIKAYNADVAAGGGFRTSEACTTSTGGGKGIFAYMRPMNEQTAPPSPPDPNPGKGGSGSQLGSFAWGTDARGNIEGFTSANTNSSNAISGSGLYLTFGGNSSYVTTDSNLSPKLGGNLNGNVPCIPSYWDTQYPDGEFKASLPSNNITGVESIDTNLTAKQFKIDNDATINNDILSYSGRRTYYIDGNLTISKDIKYFSYSNIKDIPNFTVVVKGNIYIAPGVSQLDGVYIAQPTDASGANGRIFTCNDGSPTFAITYDACSTQLKVNGAFIAQKVVLGRTYGTLDQSKYKEPANTSNAAEIFNFSPEVYLSPPVFKPIGTITSGTYDAMAILPPIF